MALGPQLGSPNTNYSPQTASPASDFSAEESTTSSVYGDPFHWDTVLAGLPPSPQYSPALAATVSERPPAGLSTPASPVPSVGVQFQAVDSYSPERDSVTPGHTTSPGIIPTIVVLNPDSVMVPTQASVSSIIGLYGDQREGVQTIIGEVSTPESQPLEEESEQESYEDDTDGEDSSPESEFEIIAVSALKVRLDAILETDETDAGNGFGSLMVRYLPCHYSLPNDPYSDPGVDCIRECQNFSRGGSNFHRIPGRQAYPLLVFVCDSAFHGCDLCLVVWSRYSNQSQSLREHIIRLYSETVVCTIWNLHLRREHHEFVSSNCERQ